MQCLGRKTHCFWPTSELNYMLIFEMGLFGKKKKISQRHRPRKHSGFDINQVDLNYDLSPPNWIFFPEAFFSGILSFSLTFPSYALLPPPIQSHLSLSKQEVKGHEAMVGRSPAHWQLAPPLTMLEPVTNPLSSCRKWSFLSRFQFNSPSSTDNILASKCIDIYCRCSAMFLQIDLVNKLNAFIFSHKKLFTFTFLLSRWRIMIKCTVYIYIPERLNARNRRENIFNGFAVREQFRKNIKPQAEQGPYLMLGGWSL